MRHLGRTLAAAGVALVLCSCAATSTVDPGAAGAVPNPIAAAQAQAALFDQENKAMDAAMVDGHPVRGTLYKHATFGSRSEDREYDAEFLGHPLAIFVRSRVLATSTTKGGNLDMLHPPGDPYDYFLLGGDYRSIAKTPWARVPTIHAAPVNVCALTGYQTVCDIQDAVKVTADEHAQVIKRVIRNGDGTETLLTGVTLRSILKYNFLLNIPKSISSRFTTAMLDYKLTAKFVLDAKHTVALASISGTVPGTTPFVAEVGFQATGTPSASDLPVAPTPAEYTAVDKKTFYADLDKINAS